MKYPRIKDLREDADLSQEEFAEKIGLYKTTYARYERGEQEIPLYIAIEICKFHNVSLDYLTGFKPKEKVPSDNIRRTLTLKQQKLLEEYEQHPELQKVIDKILDI